MTSFTVCIIDDEYVLPEQYDSMAEFLKENPSETLITVSRILNNDKDMKNGYYELVHRLIEQDIFRPSGRELAHFLKNVTNPLYLFNILDEPKVKVGNDQTLLLFASKYANLSIFKRLIRKYNFKLLTRKNIVTKYLLQYTNEKSDIAWIKSLAS